MTSFFPFQWTFEDKVTHVTQPFLHTSEGIIYIWGWNQANEGVCVRVEDFKIPMWIELPPTVKIVNSAVIIDKPIEWTEDILDKLIAHLNTKMRRKEWSKEKTAEVNTKPLRSWELPYSIDITSRTRLYNNEFEYDLSTKKYKSISVPFLEMRFNSLSSQQLYLELLRTPLNVFGIGEVLLSCLCANRNLTPVMKLMTQCKLPSAGWIELINPQVVLDVHKKSTKQHEYVVSCRNIRALANPSQMPIVHPLVCSFDIETYSHDHAHFPDPEEPRDKILQIGCVFAQKGKVGRKVCLSLRWDETVPDAEEVDEASSFELKLYKNEQALLLGWKDLVLEESPDVLIGYNIFGFDIKYMYKRALYTRNLDFLLFGCIKSVKAEYKEISWESSARGKVEFQYLNTHGRLFIDLLPVIKASENLESYKLETVAAKYLQTNKDPIKPKDIFESWKEQDWSKFYKVAKYCVQDTYVTYLLFEKLLIWFGLVESATTNKVPIFCMVSQGQQIKAYAQIFDYCFHHNMMCNPPLTKAVKSPYRGAIVTEPIPGLYHTILPFDFASLYPSIIIAHNIDFSRLVKNNADIPEHLAPTIEWTDHEGCEHDPSTTSKVIKERFRQKDNPQHLKTEEFRIVATKPKKVFCGSYKYRFMSSEAAGKGVIPSIIEELLAARKKVRKVMATNELLIESSICEADIKGWKEVNQVLEKRQLAYKVNANSMYGAYGSEQGYLPFFAGAECVTRIGRESIMKASECITQVHGGKVIYNDTDSAYCFFESLAGKTVPQVWEFANQVVENIKTLFPAPMKLEFEEKIYSKFLIFGKKRYIAEMTDENGKVKDKLYMRGVPLVRREYIEHFKSIYKTCVDVILANIATLNDTTILNDSTVLKDLKNNLLNAIMEHFLQILRSSNDTTFKSFVIFKGLNKAHEDYAIASAHVKVARKIAARGTPVLPNTRIEYVLLASPNNKFDKNAKQSDIAESLEYYKEFRSVLRLDYLQYFDSQYVNNLDQLLTTAFGAKDEGCLVFKQLTRKNKRLEAVFGDTKHGARGAHIATLFGYLTAKNKMVAQIKSLFYPVI